MSALMASAASLLVRVTAGTALFVLVLAAVQSRDARIAGMMLTFPALNGISLMLAPVADKRTMARAMLAVIALNGVVAIAFIEGFRLLARWRGPDAVLWVWPLSALAFAGWLVACWGLSRAPAAAERGFVRGFLVSCPVVAALWWVVCPLAGDLAAGSRAAGLVEVHAIRIALFALTLALLLAASEWLGASNALLGRLGAFPVLPLFSLATIAETQGGAGGGLERLAAVRPAMLIGLLLAMVFAWLYAGYLMRLGRYRPGVLARLLAALAGLIVGWIICAALIFAGMAAVAMLEGCGRL